jgi:DNA-binding LytR/AlgR family response regulator
MELQLPESSFVRIHKSFIINLNQIKSLGSKKVTLVSDQEIPIGESFRMNLLTKIK